MTDGTHGGRDAQDRDAQGSDTPDRDGAGHGHQSEHNRRRIEEANRQEAVGSGGSSGSGSVDKLNEGARQVLGDANVDYAEAEIYMEPDDAVLDAEGKAHGDRIARNPDGTHEVQSVAPGPADEPAGGWGDLPPGRKGDSVGDRRNATGGIMPESGR